MPRYRQGKSVRSREQSVNVWRKDVAAAVLYLEAYASQLGTEAYDDEQRAGRLTGGEAAAAIENARMFQAEADEVRELVGRIRDAAADAELELEEALEADHVRKGWAREIPSPNSFLFGTAAPLLYVGADCEVHARAWFPMTEDGAVHMRSRALAFTVDVFVDGRHAQRMTTPHEIAALDAVRDFERMLWNQCEGFATFASTCGWPTSSSSRPGPAKVTP